jgi:hypothetical protein
MAKPAKVSSLETCKVARQVQTSSDSKVGGQQDDVSAAERQAHLVVNVPAASA